MDRKRAEHILRKYANGTCTPAEKMQVEAWLEARAGSKDPEADVPQSITGYANIKAGLDKKISGRSRYNNTWQQIVLRAAVVLLVAATGLYLYFNNQGLIAPSNVSVQPVTPGTKAAVLTLGSGQVIKLDSHSPGVIAEEDAVQIKKSDQGKLAYDARTSDAESGVSMNSIKIPRGGQFELVLPDGTRVWLNSESSLSYPNRFQGEERRVTLTGEAYFEVVRNEKQPFIVEAGKNEVYVLGTHFNISAYADEAAITTTLLEGKVRVSQGPHKLTLLPGQQAVSKGERLIIKEVDATMIADWKNGYFVFENQNIISVMKDIARWYDLDLTVLSGNKTPKTLTGVYTRSKSLDALLRHLEKLNLAKIKRNGRRVNVML